MRAEPFYRRIMNDIRHRIETEEWPPGHKIPSSRELTVMYREMFGVRSMTTVRHAVDKLIDAGVLRSHPGLGVYVAEGEESETG